MSESKGKVNAAKIPSKPRMKPLVKPKTIVVPLSKQTMKQTPGISTFPIQKLLLKAPRTETKEEEMEDEGVMIGEGVSLPRLLLTFGNGNRFWRGTLVESRALNTQNGDTKYLLNFDSTASLPTNTLASANGFSTITTLYGEVFLHKMRVHYEPSQITGGALINATTTNLQDSPCTWIPIQHADVTITDASTAFSYGAGITGAKISNIRRRITFVWKNCEKFEWEGPLGDTTTATASQGWLEAGSIGTKLGGYVVVATYNACHTAPSNVLLPKNAQLGAVLIYYDISARMRIF